MKRSHSNNNIVLSNYIRTWIGYYLPNIRVCSSHTIRSYKLAIKSFLDYLEQVKNVSKTTLCFDHFGREYIEQWIVWLKESKGNSAQTCNLRLIAIRTFLEYLAGKDPALMYLYSSASFIPNQKHTKTRVHGISKAAVRELLAQPDATTKTGKRDLVLLITLYQTAGRIDEILSLKICQLKLDGGNPKVTIIGKGDKIRTLDLLPKTVSHIKSYIKAFHGENPSPSDFLFYSRNGGGKVKLSQTAIDKRLKHYAEIAHTKCLEIPIGLHAHQLRHAKATHWLDGGMNIVQISFLLGHSNVQTTMKYLDITTEQEKTALATLEDENTRTLNKKWKTTPLSLADFCGL